MPVAVLYLIGLHSGPPLTPPQVPWRALVTGLIIAFAAGRTLWQAYNDGGAFDMGPGFKTPITRDRPVQFALATVLFTTLFALGLVMIGFGIYKFFV